MVKFARVVFVMDFTDDDTYLGDSLLALDTCSESVNDHDQSRLTIHASLYGYPPAPAPAPAPAA
jgi:hypothetical protein